MTDQNPTSPDQGSGEGYQPPAAPGGYQPPAAPGYQAPAGGSEVPGGGYQPPAGGTEPPAGGYPPPPAGGYEPPAGGYQPPAAGGYQPPAGGYPPPAGGSEPGGYPPAGGGYPPAGGGYPPAGGGAYPPAGGPAYQAVPPGQGPYSLGDAISYGWNKFSANMGQFILVALVALGVGAVIYFLSSLIFGGLTSVSIDPYTGELRGGGVLMYVGIAIMGLLTMAGFLIASMGMTRASLDATQGRPVSIQSAFRTEDLTGFLTTQLLVALIVMVGSVLCYLPGLVAAVFLQFAGMFALDKKLGAVDAIKASFELVKANLGNAILLAIVAGLIASIGSAVCGVGALFTMPIASIALAYGYRKFIGEQVV